MKKVIRDLMMNDNGVFLKMLALRRANLCAFIRCNSTERYSYTAAAPRIEAKTSGAAFSNC